MFVGGEFYYDTFWLRDKPTFSTENMIFLNGGKACLVVISDYLLDHGVKKILLPSYLCPTIVTTLEHCGLACEYYQVNPDFSIDLDDLARKAIMPPGGLFHQLFRLSPSPGSSELPVESYGKKAWSWWKTMPRPASPTTTPVTSFSTACENWSRMTADI